MNLPATFFLREFTRNLFSKFLKFNALKKKKIKGVLELVVKFFLFSFFLSNYGRKEFSLLPIHLNLTQALIYICKFFFLIKIYL